MEIDEITGLSLDYFEWAEGDVDWHEPLDDPPPLSSTGIPPVRGVDGLVAEIREHGELGPVLVNADHEFTGPSDI